MTQLTIFTETSSWVTELKSTYQSPCPETTSTTSYITTSGVTSTPCPETFTTTTQSTYLTSSVSTSTSCATSSGVSTMAAY